MLAHQRHVLTGTFHGSDVQSLIFLRTKNISIGLIALTFGPDTRDPQRKKKKHKNCAFNDFNFSSFAIGTLTFIVLDEISELLDGLP